MGSTYHLQSRDNSIPQPKQELEKPTKVASNSPQKIPSKSKIFSTSEHPVEQATVVPTPIQSPTNRKRKIEDNSWFDKFPGLNTSEWLIQYGYENSNIPTTAPVNERYKPLFQSSLKRLVDLKKGELIGLIWDDSFHYDLKSFVEQTQVAELIFQNGKYLAQSDIIKLDEKIPFCNISFKSVEDFLQTNSSSLTFFVESIRHPITHSSSQGIEISANYLKKEFGSISCFLQTGGPNQVSYRDLQVIHLCTTINSHDCNTITKYPHETRLYHK